MIKNTIYFKKWKSPVGDLFLYSNEKSLLALSFEENKTEILSRFKTATVVKKSSKIIDKTIKQLKEYFSGKRKSFDIAIETTGTEFQKRAWTQLTKIPFGQTLSYKGQAEKIKAAKAFRAVGSANGQNHIAIIIPCHRVIASNGKLGGFAGGLHVKTKLLKLEGIETAA